MLVGGDVAQGHLQSTGQRTGGNVGEQLVPDHRLDAVGNIRVKAAGGEGIGKLLQTVSTADNAAHMGHAAAAVLGDAQTGHAGVVLRGADDDMLLRNELAQQIFVAAAVLQGHQVGIGADDALIVVQGALAEHSLDKDDDQVNRLHALGRKDRMRMENVGGSVRFLDFQPLGVHLFHQCGVYIDHGHFVVAAQVRAVQPAHGAGTKNCDFHR